jgi:hypothetical protein
MPCCVLCPGFYDCDRKKSASSLGRTMAYKNKASADCCETCSYYDKSKKVGSQWWCLRPFQFEVAPATCFEAVK